MGHLSALLSIKPDSHQANEFPDIVLQQCPDSASIEMRLQVRQTDTSNHNSCKEREAN